MKNLVITGASKGIGKAICTYFAENDWNIIFCSRNKNNLNELEDELKQINPNGLFKGIVCNVSNKADNEHFIEQCKQTFNKIDLLVNNAGVFIQGNLSDMDYESFDRMLLTNVYSAFQITQGLLPPIKKSPKALIVNISSIAGLSAYPNGGAYNVSKHALTGYSKTLRNELKEDNIAVSTIYPGATYTDSWKGVNLAEKRFIKPMDIAKIITNLYSLSNQTVVEDIVLRPMQGDI
ncbi:MAG: SDR family oxidoreductase [Chitinophagales bacterium]|nr:SDR family oxidoreductase [Chitinophagales bacterium]